MAKRKRVTNGDEAVAKQPRKRAKMKDSVSMADALAIVGASDL